MWRLLCYGLVGVLLATIGGCLEGPARSNPFDARSDAFAAIGGVAGQVLDGADQPLQSAAVRLEALAEDAATESDLALSTRTGADGSFRFDDVPAGRYRLSVTREAADATRRDTVSVEAGRVLDLGTLVLNAPPVFSEVAYDAVHLRQWSMEPGDVYRLEVTATVTDPEASAGAIAEVWLELPALGWSATLAARQPGRYAVTIDAGGLPGETLQALVGLEAWLKARDGDGAVGQTGPLVIERVVEQVPVPVAPTDFVQIAEARPTFTWETFGRPYPFTFTVHVHRVQDDIEVPVWERHGLDASATSLQVSDALAPGTYVWTVAAVDAFGNRGRSAQAGFRVVEE